MDDIYIRYLREYYNEHGTINDISTIAEVEYEGKTLKIGSFLGNMRKRYKIYLEGKEKTGKLATWRYKELTEMNFDWTPRKTKSKNIKETDPYIRYLIEHYNLHGTINDIKKNTEVEFEGKRLCIGSFISATRINYRHHLNGDKTPGCSSKTALERYRVLEELKLDWEPKVFDEKEAEKDDKRFRFLRSHYEEYGTINDLTTETVVEFEGEPLRIGSFFDYIRTAHRIYSEQKEGSYAYSERSLKRYEILDSMGFDWNPGPKRIPTIETDLFIRYLREYYSKHGTINDIPTTVEVEYEGEILKIGSFLANIRKRYKVHREGKGRPDELALWRYKSLNDMRFEWTPTKTKAENVKGKDPYIKYLRRHYNLYGTINDIDRNMEVEFEGKTLRIGVFITATRVRHRHYVNGDNTPGCASKTSLERYRILDQLKIEWEPKAKEKEARLQTNDKHLRYLREYYEEHGTINDITARTVVMFENELLKIGNFLADIRAYHRIYTDQKEGAYAYSELSLKRYEALDEMGFDWNPGIKRGLIEDDDIYIRYLQLFYMEHGSLDNVTLQDMIEFEGKVLRIRDFISNIKTRHNYYEQGINKNGSFSTRSLTRYQILDSMNFNWQSKKSEVARLATEYNIPQNTLYDNLNRFDGNLDKALSISIMRKQNREETKVKRKEQNNLENLVSSFDVNEDSLESYSTKTRSKTPQKQRDTLMYDEKTTLAEFCLQKGYNYDVILRAIKRYRQENPTANLDVIIGECISQYNSKEQGPVYNWIYGKYDNEILAKHLLISLGLDYHAVLRDMTSNSITLEEAIERECFRKSAKKEHSYLDGIFYEFMDFYQLTDSQEELDSYTKKMISKYHLSSEELEIVNTAFNKYVATIRQYQLCDIGFEKDQDTKVQKAIEYHLTPSEIEEAVFMPLRFDKKVLLGQESELAKRRATLKELTLAWHSYTDEDQIAAIEAHNLTSDEIWYITTTRQNIDTVQEKVLKISK